MDRIELIVVFFVNETGISTTWLSFVCLCDFAHPKDMCSLGNLVNNGYGLWAMGTKSALYPTAPQTNTNKLKIWMFDDVC